MPMFDFFSQLLEDVPQAAFFNAIRPFATSPGRRRSLSNLFEPMQNQFLGNLGQQVSQGAMPTLRWQDFLGEQNINKWLFEQPRFERGASTNFFNPRTRFLLGF